MEKFNTPLLERDINRLIFKKIKGTGLLVLSELRLHPCEIDLIILDRSTLRLATFEIKRTNWRALLKQAMRAKLYSHFSSAVLPITMQPNIPTTEFSKRGLGLFFYKESDNGVTLKSTIYPQLSDMINRFFKQQIYRQFYEHFGETIYA